MNIKIVGWEEIKKYFEDGSLILGNGSSIEIYSKFDYRDLFKEAEKFGRISTEASQIFTEFKSNNFEYILKHLANAAKITAMLNEKSAHGKIINKYDEVRKALYQTVKATHPEIHNIGEFSSFFDKKEFENKVIFLQNFRTIISLNYDVILYWIMIWSMKKYYAIKKTGGTTAVNVFFKDCFYIKDDLEDRLLLTPFYEELRTNKDDNRKVSLVFYPHGNIILANDTDNVPIKIKIEEGNNLLTTIDTKWSTRELTPIIICEGKTEAKLKSIEANSYTSLVFYGVLPSLPSDNIVILGWSLDDSDQHILRQILRNKPTKIAISYHKEPNEALIKTKIKSTWDGLFTIKETANLSVQYPHVYLFPASDVWKC